MESNASVPLMGKELFIDQIINIYPEKKQILIKRDLDWIENADDKSDPLICFGIRITVNDQKSFNRIKFEYLKMIKQNEDPRDRVAEFEYRDKNGLPDFNKLDRLIEIRKTRDEKADELKDELYLKDQFEKYDIPYNGPLSSL